MCRAPDDIPDAVLRLALCEDCGPVLQHAARERFGSWEAAVAAGPAAWDALPRVGALRGPAIHAGLCAADPDAERRAMAAAGVRAVVWGDDDYPALLAPVPAPPIMLWTRGRVSAAAEDSVAVVGARRATAYGISQAARFAGALAGAGIAVVSGGARGIDAEAHRAALRVGGTTVAVLGCGLGEAYPPEHASLFESIVDAGGLLVSEFPVRWPPRPSNFPRRNRIVSGMSLTVVVVEAGERSGALITARLAIDDHRRDPCAVPGPVDSARSAGTNAAIRDGWAHVVLGPDDVLRVVGSSQERRGRRATPATDMDDLGIPDELRVPLAAAVGHLSGCPDCGDDELAAVLGVDAATAVRVRTFARLVRPPPGA